MLKFLVLSLGLLVSVHSLAAEMKLVGEARLKVLFWSIYDVRLYSPDGRYSPQRYPVVLSINYLRDIKRQELLDATLEQWQGQGICQAAPCQQWLSQLQDIWPDLAKGDQLKLVADSPDRARFYWNDQPIGLLSDKGFSQHFLAIWLSEQSRFPQQQKQLTGAY